MRLTLRTLLAYVDDILEPEDAQAISKKIEESEFATTLLHRTRDVMRRLRLGAPEVTDRGAGLDPNTVGEYLDNTLPDDQVLDFEKVCLESDVHLAEVAACHQILALVLGEPAEVDPESRQRMYQLAGLVDDQIKAASDASAEPAPLPSAGPAIESRPDVVDSGPELITAPPQTNGAVPQWLRDGSPKRRRWWPVVATVGIVLVCGLVVMAVTGQLRPGALLPSGQEDPSIARAPDPTEAEAQLPPETATDPAGPASQEPSKSPSPTPEPGRQPGTSEGQLPTTPSPETAGEAQATDMADPVAPSGTPVGESPAEPSPEPESTPPLRQPFPAAEFDRPAMVEPASPMAQPSATDLAVNTPKPVLPPTGGGKTPAGAQPEARPDAARAPVPMEPIGQLDSPMQIVLRFDAKKSAWQRLPDQAPLMPQTKYLALPTYRPMFELLNQVRVWLVEGAELELLPADPDGTPGLALQHGRLVVEAPEQAPSRLRLAVADRVGTITFQDADSRLGVELTRALASNDDPETQPAPVVANLYAASGQILWQEQRDNEPTAVAAPVRLALSEQPPQAVPVQKFPNWIVPPTMSLLDQRASSTVQRELAVSRSANLGLRELADHRRKEVRWLALRCLEALGNFDLMVTALDNPDENMAWPDYVAQLRAAVVRSPEAAAQVRTAMERLHGIEGASLYELLWRYNHDALDGQEAASLVEYLEHDTLAFRVVAFQTLKRTTKLTINYRPEDTAHKRQPWVEKWRERLESSTRLAPPKPDGTQESPDRARPPFGGDNPL